MCDQSINARNDANRPIKFSSLHELHLKWGSSSLTVPENGLSQCQLSSSCADKALRQTGSVLIKRTLKKEKQVWPYNLQLPDMITNQVHLAQTVGLLLRRAFSWNGIALNLSRQPRLPRFFPLKVLPSSFPAPLKCRMPDFYNPGTFAFRPTRCFTFGMNQVLLEPEEEATVARRCDSRSLCF